MNARLPGAATIRYSMAMMGGMDATNIYAVNMVIHCRA